MPPRPSRLSQDADAASELLQAYEANSSFFFASPALTLHGRGLWTRRQSGTGPDLISTVQALLSQARQHRVHVRWPDADQNDRRPASEAIVAGAVPFDPEMKAVFVVPERTDRAGRLPSDLARGLMRPDLDGVAEITARPSPQEYEQMVEQALLLLRSGQLDKVVLGRTLEIKCDQVIDLPVLLTRLAQRNPDGYTFALRATSTVQLIGASPELLIRKQGNQITLRPMAGTLPRLPDPQADAEQAATLLTSQKNLYEHQVVIGAIESSLAPLCSSLSISAPRPVATATLWHLETPISGRLHDPSLNVLELVQRLHPTPAVCGVPEDAAREFIRRHEPSGRGLFSGAVGWCDDNGDGEWAVTLRCAEVSGNHARLFAGAGIVADSVPVTERAETDAKFLTILRALNLAGKEGSEGN